MAVIALVPGAAHGAWCFERLARELRALGHDPIAVELPCDDVDAGAVRYAAVVAEATAHVPGPVVVVGHSLAGITIPLVPRLRPVERLVYLAAVLPLPGRTLADQYADDPQTMPGFGDEALVDGRGRTVWPAEPAARWFYDDCEPGDAAWAAARLRPQAVAPRREPCPLDAFPDVPSHYVLCRGDRVVSPEWSRRAAPERLGVRPIELDGGHSPFLTRPRELARLLDALAAGTLDP